MPSENVLVLEKSADLLQSTGLERRSSELSYKERSAGVIGHDSEPDRQVRQHEMDVIEAQ